MQLIQTEASRWTLLSRFEERHVPKDAGFRWDPIRKQWWTTNANIAVRLADLAAPELRAKLLTMCHRSGAAEEASVAEAVEASRATEADIAIPLPPGRVLYGYQRAGVAWCIAHPFALIGDEMGLGKTVQAVCAVNCLAEVKKVLIVCPASLRLNWAREWHLWSTRLHAAVALPGKWPWYAEAIIVSYESAVRIRATIERWKPQVLILDEVHYLKSKNAQRTGAIFGRRWKDKNDQWQTTAPIPAERIIAMTGTPLLNRPEELWTIVHRLDPDGLGRSYRDFTTRYCGAYQDEYGYNVKGHSNLDRLQRALRSTIMVRRLKADVLTELPPKRRQIVTVEPTAEGERLVAEEKAKYHQHEATIAAIKTKLAAIDSATNRSEYEETVAALRTAQGVAFAEMSRLRHLTALAKVPAVIEHLRNALEEGGKIICFGHHLDVIAQIHAEFAKTAGAVVFTGETKPEERQRNVDRFQKDDKCRLFIGAITAAGLGITLTAASHVVMAELDWRPAIVTQAEDRAHRIGQAESVLVQHLVIDNSLDANMAEKVIEKQRIADQALDVAKPEKPNGTGQAPVPAEAQHTLGM